MSTVSLEQFKPFTMDEVKQITGCDNKLLDKLTSPVDGCLQIQQGQGTYGLDFLQAFQVYVAWRYLEEGGGMERALWAMKVIAALSLEGLDKNHRKGWTFIVGREIGKVMLVKPPLNRLGKALCTKRMLQAFRARLDVVFPKG